MDPPGHQDVEKIPLGGDLPVLDPQAELPQRGHVDVVVHVHRHAQVVAEVARQVEAVPLGDQVRVEDDTGVVGDPGGGDGQVPQGAVAGQPVHLPGEGGQEVRVAPLLAQRRGPGRHDGAVQGGGADQDGGDQDVGAQDVARARGEGPAGRRAARGGVHQVLGDHQALVLQVGQDGARRGARGPRGPCQVGDAADPGPTQLVPQRGGVGGAGGGPGVSWHCPLLWGCGIRVDWRPHQCERGFQNRLWL